MRFKRSVPLYGRTPEPETPFQRAGQLWDERIGSARVQARAWRIMGFGSLGLTCAVTTGFVWLAAQSRVVPYVVEVDRLGAARAVSEADRGYKPTDPQIAWALSKYIAHVRGVSLDPVVMRADWLEAYDFSTERGGRALSEYARASGALTRIGERTLSVQVTSVVRASEASFQVKWTERAFERGNATGTSRWTAILTLVERPPRDAETLRRNPLGIYVDAIDWSQELEPAGQGASVGPEPGPAELPTPETGDRASSHQTEEVLP